jgi:hypothetical protein
MKTSIKAAAVVILSTATGVALGLTPSWLRSVRGAEPAPKHNFRSRIDGFNITSPALNTLRVQGVFRVGDPEPEAEVRAQHLMAIRDEDGLVAVDQELGRINIKPGQSGLSHRIDVRYAVPSGAYSVHLFSHVPGHTHTEDGVVGPQIMSDVMGTVVVN